jgi:hypothetical protein
VLVGIYSNTPMTIGVSFFIARSFFFKAYISNVLFSTRELGRNNLLFPMDSQERVVSAF